MRMLIALLAFAATSCGERHQVTINPDVKNNPAEYAVAQIALKTVLGSCKMIDVVTPSGPDPGGYIIDCISGERYRMRAGEAPAKYERKY